MRWGFVASSLALLGLIGLVAVWVKPVGTDRPEFLDIYPLKGMVCPGEEVPLKARIRFSGVSRPPLKLRVKFTQVFEEIGTSTIDVAGDETTFVWKTPSDPPEAGYGIEAELLSPEGRVFGRRSTAVDVGRDWTRKPRYGFLSDFGPDQVGQRARFEVMSRFHLNGLQFYDWMYRHSDYLPPAEEYRDPLNRAMSLGTVRDKIDLAREYGMASMAYTAIYGAPVDFYRRHPDWALYKGENDPVRLGDDFLVIMNPERGSPWRQHMVSEYRKIVTALPFDGIHLDQYGDPRFALAYPPEKGRTVDVGLEIPSLIDETKDAIEAVRPRSKVIFNNVGNWPVKDTASTKVDFVYTEVWPPYRFFQHLKELIDEGRKEGGGKAVVLAAYVSPKFVPSVLLTDAAIFASGGYHLELGEGVGMLRDPYFPKYMTMDPELEGRLRRYYDFAVRYQDLLYSGDLKERDLSEGGVEVKGAKTIDKGYFNAVWVIAKENPRYQVTHLINLLELESAEWNAPRQEGPKPLADVRVRITSPTKPKKAFFLSPDREEIGARSVPFDYEGGVVTLTLPGLEYWDLVVFQK